jgi:hypothetical protein
MFLGFSLGALYGVVFMSKSDLMMAFGFKAGALGGAAFALHAMVFETIRCCHGQGAPSRCVEGVGRPFAEVTQMHHHRGHLLPLRVLNTEERCTFLSTMTFLGNGFAPPFNFLYETMWLQNQAMDSFRKPINCMGVK